MKRRAFLAGLGVAGAGMIAAPYVHAQGKKFAGVTVRVNGYGGVYDAALSSVAKPLEDKYGFRIQITPGQTTADVIKMISAPDNPPFDVFLADSPMIVEVVKAGIVAPLSTADIPSLSRVIPGMMEFGEFAAPISVASVVPFYHSKSVSPAVTSYSDIARPDLKQKVVVASTASNANTLMVLGLAEENGGSIDDMEPAFKVIAAAKPNLVALPATTVAQVQMIAGGEATAGVFWDGRLHELRVKNVPVVTVAPSKGIYAVTTYLTIAKATKVREAASIFIEAMLADEGMLALPKALRYGVTTDIKLPTDIASDLLFNSPERFVLKKKIDWTKFVTKRGEWMERLNKELRT